jgi:flagellar biosynthesis protein FlhB
MADQGQRTEQPTERRIEKARQEGQFSASREFVSSIQFAVFVALLVGLSSQWLQQARQVARFLLTRGFHGELNRAEIVRLFHGMLLPAIGPLLLAGVVVMVATMGAQLATTRMGVSVKKLAPDFQRFNPVKKLRDLPRQNLPQFYYALLLLPLFAAAVYLIVSENLASFLALPLIGVEGGLRRVAASLESLLWRATGLFLLLGVVDLVRQRRRYRKDLRMSKQEIRDELKEVEGNPQIKMRVRRLQRDLLRRQMMREVPKATAVIVNPTHFAVAIRYQVEAMAAPRVVAKGKNYLALRIRQKAIEHQVPIVENAPLAQALYKSAEVGQEIPVHLYRAVAEILAYIYRLMNGRLPA